MSLRNWILKKLGGAPPTSAAIVISYSSQMTPNPVVCVSAHGRRGMQTIYTFKVKPGDPQGDAASLMYGRSLANIIGIRLVDERQPFCRTCGQIANVPLCPKSPDCALHIPWNPTL